MLEGWSCPHCGRAHAPDVKTCPEPKKASGLNHEGTWQECPICNPEPRQVWPPEVPAMSNAQMAAETYADLAAYLPMGGL